ncbi:MAG: hypothetical protein ACXWB9_09295, partial [Flavisolibacter sp.]
LDIDLPSDDDGGGNSPAPKPGPGIIGWGLSVILIAFFTFYFLFKDNKPAVLRQSTPVISNPSIQPASQAESPPGNLPASNGPSNVMNESAGTLFQDDSVQAGIQQDNVSIEPFQSDTTAIFQPGNDLAGLAKAPQLKTDSIIPKKKKGMNLKDEDYRIVPKKEDNK